MENNGSKVQLCVVDPNTVNVPRDEYDDLIFARSCIDMIGKTLGRFGPNETVVKAVLSQFGYVYKEGSADA